MDARHVILCVPVGFAPDMPEEAKYGIYRQAPCHYCGDAMWLGERSEALMKAKPGAIACCMVCGILIEGAGPDTELKKLTDRDN